jgi:hypothetical protein
VVILGDGERALFWKDRWLNGARVADLAPNLLALVASRKVSTRTVKEGLGGEWLRDCGPDLGHAAVAEFFLLWRVVGAARLVPERSDEFVWRWSVDGKFSVSSAYRAFFAGRVGAPTASQIWRSRAPYSCKFFAWLISRNICWTADRLQRRGLPAPASCPLCNQEPETIQHLLLGCVVAREVWTWALSRWGKLGWLPAADEDLVSWWTTRPGLGASQRDLWTSLILVFWSIWTHMNDVVFNSARPAVLAIKTKAGGGV